MCNKSNFYKMNSVKIISRGLYFICLLLASVYLLSVLVSLVAFVTGWGYEAINNGSRFAIKYPFTRTNFLLGESAVSYKLFNFLAPITFFGLFFLSLSKVFNHFTKDKLFTQDGVVKMRQFYLLNLIVPGVLLLLQTIFGKMEEGFDVLTVVLFILGIFAFFLAAIFKQGVKLQNDQDLFI